MILKIRHVSGKSNIAGPSFQVGQVYQHGMVLEQTVASYIFQILNFPGVDLFTTRFNHKLPLYILPVPDKQAFTIDAPSMNWNDLHPYTFPPMILILTILTKSVNLVQNGSNCSSLTSISFVSRGVTTTNISTDSSSNLSKTTSQAKVFCHQSPNSCSLHLGVIKQSLETKNLASYKICLQIKKNIYSEIYDTKWSIYSN